MNKLFNVILATLLALAPVMAIPSTGFEFHKFVEVTGDWAWNGCNWEQGTFTTATYNMDVYSGDATDVWYAQGEEFGQQWHYDGWQQLQSNAPADFYNGFDIDTVNPPDTTPGTEWTSFEYNQHTEGSWSSSDIYVTGFGNAQMSSDIFVDSDYAFQWAELGIND